MIVLFNLSQGQRMKVTLIALTLTICSFQAMAQGPSRTEEQFCSDRQDENFVKDLTMSSSNLMSFTNHGGLLNGGVCWWHSRFQRNALYLTIFKPGLDKPSDSEARKLIGDIRSGNKVVTIPGFRNFSQFSYEFGKEIQQELESWQRFDGVAKFAWVRGLSGHAEVAPDKLEKLMDKIYEDVEINKNIAYNRLQIPGVDAHAWLVVHMDKVRGGYNLEILDSNQADRTETYRYRVGDTNFNYRGYDFDFVPYLDQKHEMKGLKRAISRFCESN